MGKTTKSIFLVMFLNFILFFISFQLGTLRTLRISLVFITLGYTFLISFYETFIDRKNKLQDQMTNIYLMVTFETFILAVSFLTETLDELRAIIIGIPMIFFILSWIIDKDKN